MNAEAPFLESLRSNPSDDKVLLVDAAPPQTSTADDLKLTEIYVEEFKPTFEEWENVKELEFPHPHPPVDANEHPYKPEILERDSAGDWSEVPMEPLQY